ncbi:MAG TPA: c-type cytochrome [Hyphomicrobium sp.]|nr:c-type cytochrome [Hyphomicrobium sp.]
MEMFKRHCASCHGASGQGDGPRAGVLKIAPTDLTRLSRDNGGTFPKAKVADVIKTGGSPLGHGTDMPAWMKIFGVKGQPDETRNRIHRLVQYIESLQK